MRLIGLCSYSLYLIHWPLFSFTHLYLGAELSLALRLLLIAVSFILALLSWRFIETPARAAKLPNGWTFGMAAAAMCVLFAAGTAYSVSEGFPDRVSEKVVLAQPARESCDEYCRSVAVPGIPGRAAYHIGENREGPYDFVLWGDSHAFHFVPAIDTLAKSHRLSGVVFWEPGCPPFLIQARTTPFCRNLNAAVARWIEKHPPKVVILGGRWIGHSKYIRRSLASGDPALNPEGLSQTLAFLNERNIAVSILDQVPEFPENVSACVARGIMYGRTADRCMTMPLSAYKADHKILDDYFNLLRQRYRFSVASVATAICRDDGCHANNGDTVLMRDSNHLNRAGSLYVTSSLRIPFLSEEIVKDAAAKRAGATAPLPSL
jgi:hypothetical protein